MSEKIIDTAEQTAEAAPKAAKKKPAALKKPADSGSFCVYLGPTMMGVIQRGTIYRGGRKEVLDALAPVIAQYPLIASLVGADPGPRRWPPSLRLLLLFVTMSFHAFFGVTLVTSEVLLVPEWFGLLGRTWGDSAIADQQVGGSIAWGIGEIPTMVLAVVVAVRWAKDDERAARRRDRRIETRGDVELDDYNAMLAKLAERDR